MLLKDSLFHEADHHLRKVIDTKFPLDNNLSRGGTFSNIDGKAAINLDKANLSNGSQEVIANLILENQEEFISFALGQESKEISRILDSFFGN